MKLNELKRHIEDTAKESSIDWVEIDVDVSWNNWHGLFFINVLINNWEIYFEYTVMDDELLEAIDYAIMNHSRDIDLYYHKYPNSDHLIESTIENIKMDI